jgi:hypothetical protein
MSRPSFVELLAGSSPLRRLAGALFRQVVGNDEVRFLDVYPASEGFVAAEDPRRGRLRLIPDHDIFFEFARPPFSVEELGRRLDAALCRVNEDYQADRAWDLTLRTPEVWAVRRGGFAGWMRSRGKLGGQHKVLRMDNDGRTTEELACWLDENQMTAPRPAAPASVVGDVP